MPNKLSFLGGFFVSHISPWKWHLKKILIYLCNIILGKKSGFYVKPFGCNRHYKNMIPSCLLPYLIDLMFKDKYYLWCWDGLALMQPLLHLIKIRFLSCLTRNLLANLRNPVTVLLNYNVRQKYRIAAAMQELHFRLIWLIERISNGQLQVNWVYLICLWYRHPLVFIHPSTNRQLLTL